MLTRATAARPRGFTLIELAVTMAVLALLAVLAVPNLSAWMQNARVRTTADLIQDGLRQAQTEAVKQNRVVAFFLTNTQPTPTSLPAPAAAGSAVKYWYAATVPWTTAQLTSNGVTTTSNQLTMVANGIISSDAAQVTTTELSGTIQTLCFSPYGRLTATSNDPSASPVTCNVPTNTPPLVSYEVAPITASSTAHKLHVTVSLGGQIRMCDPNKSLSNNAPDGC
jgi:type IV fimbrial biogenesis protein FimT